MSNPADDDPQIHFDSDSDIEIDYETKGLTLTIKGSLCIDLPKFEIPFICICRYCYSKIQLLKKFQKQLETAKKEAQDRRDECLNILGEKRKKCRFIGFVVCRKVRALDFLVVALAKINKEMADREISNLQGYKNLLNEIIPHLHSAEVGWPEENTDHLLSPIDSGGERPTDYLFSPIDFGGERLQDQFKSIPSFVMMDLGYEKTLSHADALKAIKLLKDIEAKEKEDKEGLQSEVYIMAQIENVKLLPDDYLNELKHLVELYQSTKKAFKESEEDWDAISKTYLCIGNGITELMKQYYPGIESEGKSDAEHAQIKGALNSLCEEVRGRIKTSIKSITQQLDMIEKGQVD